MKIKISPKDKLPPGTVVYKYISKKKEIAFYCSVALNILFIGYILTTVYRG